MPINDGGEDSAHDSVQIKRRGSNIGPCLFCNRRLSLTFHHLIPRKVHRRTRFKKHYPRATLQQGILVCRDCHRGIHRRFSEMELAKTYNTPEKLQADAELSRHFLWVSKQKKRELL